MKPLFAVSSLGRKQSTVYSFISREVSNSQLRMTHIHIEVFDGDKTAVL